MSGECPTCRVERVALADVPRCFLRAVAGAIDDLGRRDVSWTTALEKDDRALYLVGLVILVLLARLVSHSV